MIRDKISTKVNSCKIPQLRQNNNKRGWIKNKPLAGALILNAGYEPIKIVNWQKAIILWLQDKVEVLEYHLTSINSPSRSFQLPSVLRLKQYVRPYFSFKIRLSRQNIFLRDNYQCQYCCKKFAEKKLTIDHVTPLSRGGLHTWDNVVAACSACNNKKGNKTVEQARMALMKMPAKPSWLPLKEFDLNSGHLPISWKLYIGNTAAE